MFSVWSSLKLRRLVKGKSAKLCDKRSPLYQTTIFFSKLKALAEIDVKMAICLIDRVENTMKKWEK